MAQSWTFGKRIALGFGISVAILLVVGWVTYRSTDLLIENDHTVTRTHAVIEQITHLLSLAKDAETGQRGYLLTGDDAYLEPYRAATDAMGPALADLRKLVADNPRQLARVDEGEPIILAKLAELKRTVDLRRTEGFDASLKVVLSGRGKQLMDDFRRVMTTMDREARDSLMARNEMAEASAAAAKTTIEVGVALAFVCVSFAGFIITRSLNQQLGSAIAGMRSSSTELQAAATQQASGSREQATATTQISTTIKELVSTSKQIAESAQRVARIAEETAGGARLGDQTVRRAQEGITGIRRQVDLIVTHMLELGKKSQQAGGILELINELSEQTNILSINATIEAAGAGEAGRRFAVVADEIRKLADRVASSTKEIRTVIEDIRSAVNTTVMATESGTKAVDAGAKQFADVTSSFGQIVSLVGTTTEAAREIELSTKQQTSAVEQVNAAIANVAQAAKETESSSAQTLQTSTQLAGLSRDLSRMIQANG